MHHLTLGELPTDVVALLDGLDWALSAASAIPAARLPWIHWNLANDGWYTPDLLQRLAIGFRAMHLKTGKRGLALVQELAACLRNIRLMEFNEISKIPVTVVTHVSSSKVIQRYRPTGAGWWFGHSITEIVNDYRSRTSFLLRPANYRGPAWFSFGSCATKHPDEVCKELGLPWKPAFGELVRLRVSYGSLQKRVGGSYIPTLFDSYSHPIFTSIWRARPLIEKKPNEPWGTTRDLVNSKAGHPEILVELSRHDIFTAERIGAVTREHTEDYLSGVPQ